MKANTSPPIGRDGLLQLIADLNAMRDRANVTPKRYRAVMRGDQMTMAED